MIPINVPSSGLWAYQNRVGTIHKQGEFFVFTSLDAGARLYTAILREEPEWLGTDWISVGEFYKNSRWTRERWARDVNEFVQSIIDAVEEQILDDEVDDEIYEKVAIYDDDDDETTFRWGTTTMRDVIYQCVKDEASKFAWYSDDNALDRALSYLQFLCFDVDCTHVRNWNDFKRIYFMQVLQAYVHQKILDKMGVDMITFT